MNLYFLVKFCTCYFWQSLKEETDYEEAEAIFNATFGSYLMQSLMQMYIMQMQIYSVKNALIKVCIAV